MEIKKSQNENFSPFPTQHCVTFWNINGMLDPVGTYLYT